MKRFFAKPKEQNNDRRTLPPLGENSLTPVCPTSFDSAPAIFVLPQPPLIYRINRSQQQSGDTYPQDSTQTELAAGECFPELPKQPSLENLRQLSHEEIAQACQPNPTSLTLQSRQFSSGQPSSLSRQRPASAGQSSLSSGQPASSAGQYLPSSGQHSASTSQPPSYSGQPSASSGQFSLSSGNPAASAGQYLPSSGQHPASTSQPPPYSGHPPPYSGQPPPYSGHPPPPPFRRQPNHYQAYYDSYYGTHVYQYPVHPPPVNAAGGPMIRQNPTFRRTREEPEPEGWTGFSDKIVRAKFIRKVYIILALQLLFTLGNIALFIYEPNVKTFVREHGYLMFVAIWYIFQTRISRKVLEVLKNARAIFFSVYIGIICFESVRRKFPTNIIALIIFTMSLSYMCSTISTVYDTDIVLMAVGICAAVCLTVTIFSFYTKFDFTTCGGILCILMLILFLFGIIAIFFPTNVMRYIYAGLGATVFTFMLAYNTQEVMGGKRHEISPEDYVFAAIQLYVDMIYIFLFILQLLGIGGEQ